MPQHDRYGGSRFIVAWVRRRKRHKARIITRQEPPSRSPKPRRSRVTQLGSPQSSFLARTSSALMRKRSSGLPSQSVTDYAILTDDDDDGDDINVGAIGQKTSFSAPRTSVTKFTAFMAGKGGVFWSSLSTALVAISYSSILTFVFLVAFSTTIMSWAFGVAFLHPEKNAGRCLRWVRVYRVYILSYLTVLICFQLPWLAQWFEPENSTVSNVLQFIGLVPVDTSWVSGWTAVMAFGAAIATYLFTGMFQTSLHNLNAQRSVRSSESGRASLASTPDAEMHRSSNSERKEKPSYYEVQLLLVIMHGSALGLLAWALVFPGALTLLLLCASILYLSLDRFRKSRLMQYVLVYAFLLQLVHYMFIAVTIAFPETTSEHRIIRVLGLESLQPQFSVNLIESIAIGFLCVNISGRRYLDRNLNTTDPTEPIREFVLMTHFSSRFKKRDSLFSPLKLIVDQLALASLYVAGGLDLTILNAVFLVTLSAICILQSFGLFRRSRIFFIAWCTVLAYSIAFLVTTATVCRAVNDLCGSKPFHDNVGLKMATRGQVVAYATTVVLASIQVNFTWRSRSVEEVDYAKGFDSKFWKFLRDYFLYATYAALLLYPLLFPANFLSYGYVVFLFLSIVVELLLPSLRGRKADVRQLLKKFWIFVIAFACAAMLSRFFIRLQWFKENEKAQRWFFGLRSDDSREIEVTIGDAILLIVMSLQGRLFKVDSVVATDRKERQEDGLNESNNQHIMSSTEREDVLPEPGDLSLLREELMTSPQKHQRHKSVEEFVNRESFPEAAHDVLPRRASASFDRLSLRPSRDSLNIPDGSERGSSEHSEAIRVVDEEDQRRSELLQLDLNRARLEQAVEAIRNFRKSVPVKQTEKCLQEMYAFGALLVRNGMLRYSYVLQAVAILVASIWLPGVSLFGAVYVLLGCIILVAKQPSFRRDNEYVLSRANQSASTIMPVVLIIFSFSLMSAQYIFLIVHIIRKSVENVFTTYLGLQAPADETALPISVHAMVAHVIVFITAVVQKISVRWAKMDAELLYGGENATELHEQQLTDADQSARELDSAVPIGAVVKGVGGTNEGNDLEPSHKLPFVPGHYDTYWAETQMWKSTSKQDSQTEHSIRSDLSEKTGTSHSSYSSKRNEKDRMEHFRTEALLISTMIYERITRVLSLLSPFWKDWGFDATLVYLVVSGVSTQTVFSVVYIGLVLAFACLRKTKIRQHWHQISLFLAVLVLVQYLLTLGLPPTENSEKEMDDEVGPWKVWAFLDEGNDSVDRKLAISCAFVAAILAGVTLNAVSDEPRGLQYWFKKMTDGEVDIKNSTTGGSSLRGFLEQHPIVGRDQSRDSNGEDMPENLAVAPKSVIHDQNGDPHTYGPENNDREEGTESLQPTITSFISGLGQQKKWKDQEYGKIRVARERPAISSEDESYEPNLKGASRTWRKEPDEGDASRVSDSLPRTSSSMGCEMQFNLSESSLRDIEKGMFRRIDPRDFTRRPISFEKMIKLLWMRFSGPLVQLYVLAVATVTTNVISAILLAIAFSFLFQFTEVSAKRPRLMFLRVYVIVVIAALVIFQAPFEPSPGVSDQISSGEFIWSDIVGLYKKDQQTGRTFLYLLVSLWILCQIQARIYQSPDFQYVEKYSQEDAKVRFKRAVHEHNSRKYEKMLERNKAERSHYARKARLIRLKALQKTKRTVDAFYNVCVENEISFLKQQVESLKTKSSFSSHRLVDDPKKKENLPLGLNKALRRILRGKHWTRYVNQSLSSEMKAFVFCYSAWPVYGTMLLAAIANPSITTVVYPLIVFLYLIVEQPRPPKQAWTILMVYVCFAIAFKYVLRSPQFRFCDTSVPFFGHGGSEDCNPSVRNFDHCAPAAGIGFDIFVLLALLGHRAVLYSRGLWDLGMSEEDMLLRSEIRGQELDTPSEMMYNPGSVDGEEDVGSEGFKDEAMAVDHVWEAEQQCDDVEHVLSQAQRDIAGDIDDPKERLRTVKVPQPLPFVVQKAVRTGADGPPPAPALPVPALDLFAAGASVETVGGGSDALRRQHAARQKQKSDGWKDNWPQHTGRSAKDVPKSAPLPTRTRKDNDPRDFPSVQGPEFSRGHTGLAARLLALRLGHQQAQDPAATSETMTPGQSRVQEALIQGRIIPEQPISRRRNTLSLFNTEQKGFTSTLRQYFLRLTKENDHKAVGDYYLLIFVIDFISFVYVMFGFSAIFGEGSSGRQSTWWTTNFIETRHLVTLLVMFTMIILDRVCYLTRSMVGKLILQYISVFAYHIILFVVQDYVGVRAATQIFYILRCVYFLLSGLQLRDGFPMYTTAQFLMRNFSTLGIVLFEIYIFVPFLWLTRTLLDWAVLPTSLEIFQYFRFIDIYMWLYRNRAINRSRGGFQRKLGEKRRMFPRVYQGFGLFLLCVIALFLPFIIFSIFNPFFVGRKLREAKVSVDLVIFGDESYAGRSYEIYRRTSFVGEELDRSEALQVAGNINTRLDLREREKVFEARFSFMSDSVWQPAEEDRRYLIESLSNYSRSGNNVPPQLSFLLSAITQDLVTFGTESMEINVSKAIAGEMADALSEGSDFAEIFQSPLHRYLIVQSGSTVFDSSENEPKRDEVCVRLIQREGLAFWMMGDCFMGKCDCERTSPVTGESRRYLLQIADISALQVGGATILTLYTAILFTIGSLLKRMFINMRFLVPYIDMPYTLHLYQLALDIMYARQDNQLEMEEILYNGLIDIYRDQHELVRWTGERALKLPIAWWDKSEVENPFMVYPSFMETDTEPYLDRTIE